MSVEMPDDDAVIRAAAFLFKAGKASSKDAAFIMALEAKGLEKSRAKLEAERLRRVAKPIWAGLISTSGETEPVFLQNPLHKAEKTEGVQPTHWENELIRKAPEDEETRRVKTDMKAAWDAAVKHFGGENEARQVWDGIPPPKKRGRRFEPKDPAANSIMLDVYFSYCEEGAKYPKAATVKKVLSAELFRPGKSEDAVRVALTALLKSPEAEERRLIKARKAEEVEKMRLLMAQKAESTGKRQPAKGLKAPRPGETLLTTDPVELEKTKKK